MQISLTIPEGVKDRVIEAISVRHGYQDTIPDGQGGTVPNLKTRQQFCKDVLLKFIKDTVKDYEGEQAYIAAANAARAKAEADIVLS